MNAPHSRSGTSHPLGTGSASGPATPTSHGTDASGRSAPFVVCSMEDTAKFDFCSAEWIAAAREYLLAASAGADLAGLHVSFNEVFTDPPSHLDPAGTGRIGWYMRIADRQVEVGEGILPEADLRLTVDYATVLPAARRLSTDAPFDDATQAALTEAINREGDPAAMAEVGGMAGLHDAMAVQTR